MGVVAKPESNCLPVLADSSLSGSKQYNHLHTTFLIMLFHSSLISFVITIALVSGITAFVNPVQRDSSCQPGTGVVQCCGAVNSFSSLPSSVQSTVTSADPNGDYSQTAGQNCSPSGPDWYCTPRIPSSIKWLNAS